jgi:hypothetical protein
VDNRLTVNRTVVEMIQVNNWSIPMKTVKDYADWFIEHDKHLTEVHLIIERDALKKELQNLEDEWDKMRKHLHQVEALIEKQQELTKRLLRGYVIRLGKTMIFLFCI